MADRLGVAAVLTTDRWRDRLTAPAVLAVDDPPPPAPDPPDPGTQATDPAYAVFTSGSTGRPKAVGVPHRGAVRLVRDTDYISLSSDDTILATTSPAFDVSCFEVFGAHLNGARLVLPDPDALLSPPDLAGEIERSGATVMWLTAGLFHQMGFAQPDMFGGLRYLIAGGDTVNPECMREILAAAPPDELRSGYGPAENSTFSSTHRVAELPPTAQTVPIGRPIANSTCYVLREDASVCAPEEEGELFVGGDGVALGYLGDEQRTAERFVPDPFADDPGARMYRTGDRGLWRSDGVLEFTGRMDRQVKVRGYRVELGEIETAATAHPDVHDAKVIVDEPEPGERALVLWAAPRTPDQDGNRFVHGLRTFLRDRLPRFMVPARFAIADRLPLGRTGKVDAQAVKDLAAESATGPEASDPPRGDTERTVARLWAEQLGLERVGRRDDFFAVGGESLQAVRLVTALRNELHLDTVPGRVLVRMLLDTPVLHRFAERLDAAREGRVEPDQAPVDLHAEARLDPALRFGAPRPAATPDPRAVLLTGATGFLGAFLTRRLLDATTARLYCPVRAADPDDGLRRIAAALRRYELPLGDLELRVTAVPADLAEPRLGLDGDQFAQLADQVDVILHNGAHVNFLYPFSRLVAANVGGVRELIRLASGDEPKPFHYVSSIAVHAGLGTTGRRQMAEDDPLGDPELLGQGYAETKWVAETMLRAAAERGLPVSLYRPGEITGTRDRGAQGTGTMLSALFKAITDTGLAPAVPFELNLIPVEVVAEALVRLLLTEPARGHAYHLVNPAPAPLSLLADRAQTLGYRIRRLPYDEWLREMNRYAAADPAAPIADYLPMFSERSAKTGLSVFEASFPGNMPHLATANFTGAAPGMKIPAVDADLLDRYLRYWLASGFLTRPTSRSTDEAAPLGNGHS